MSESEQCVAFLRAINVGSRRVKKERLQELFEELGFTEVSTYLASGNVIFETDQIFESDRERDGLERRIAAHLEEELGYDVPTFVRSMDEVVVIAKSTAFAEAARESEIKRYVILTSEGLSDQQTRDLAGLTSEVDEFLADGHEIYWLRRVEAGESMPTGGLEGALGITGTRRNLNTMQRLVAKFGA